MKSSSSKPRFPKPKQWLVTIKQHGCPTLKMWVTCRTEQEAVRRGRHCHPEALSVSACKTADLPLIPRT